METNQEEIRRQVDLIVSALIASEPRTPLAAEAFDGLRRNVAFAAQERRRQLSQLVAFADAIERGATIDTLRERCEQWCAEAGLRRYLDPAAQPDWFEVVEGEGAVLEPVEPAWVDTANQVLVRPGTARRVHVARPQPDGEPQEPHPEEAQPEEPQAQEAQPEAAQAEAAQAEEPQAEAARQPRPEEAQ